jgi:hypothetical protein
LVSNLQLATGQFIGAGQAALTFIDLSTVWVSAEFKENSLEYMSTSDRAELVFDSLPGAIFKAHVESNTMMDRNVKLHQREFDVLPETWGVLTDATCSNTLSSSGSTVPICGNRRSASAGGGCKRSCPR